MEGRTSGLQVDHLVYGAPDLATGTERIEALLGVRPAPGGTHVGIGTHNALIALGEGAYLEIIAPDPDQQARMRPLPYGLDTLEEPRLMTWAIKAPDIEAQASRARAAGIDLGPVVPMARERPDGTRLEWRLTRSPLVVADGLVPFLIEWGPGAHPSETAPSGARLVTLRGEHPEPERTADRLQKAGVTVPLTRGPKPALIATLEGVRGAVDLR